MPVIELDLPESIYAQLKDIAQREGISVSEFITIAVAEKLAALTTETHLADRARKGDRLAFEQVLAKVPSHELPSSGPDAADKV